MPLTSGFFAKFYVLERHRCTATGTLAIVAMLSAVIAAFLYLRIIVAMYIGPTTRPSDGHARRAAT